MQNTELKNNGSARQKIIPKSNNGAYAYFIERCRKLTLLSDKYIKEVIYIFSGTSNTFQYIFGGRFHFFFFCENYKRLHQILQLFLRWMSFTGKTTIHMAQDGLIGKPTKKINVGVLEALKFCDQPE